MNVNIKITGQNEIKRKIALLEKKASAELKVAITKSAIHVEGEAKNTSAWKNVTNRLRPSITHDVKSRGAKHFGRVGTNVFYGAYLEFGTKKMAARPWLIPALTNSARVILGFLNKALKGLKP